MFAETGCDAVMIGRAALGKPWIFHQIAHQIRTGEVLPAPTPQERARLALRHAQIVLETTHMPHRQAILELRGQLTQYHLGVHGASSIRDRLVHVENMADIEAILLPLIG